MKENLYNIYFCLEEAGNIFDYQEPAIVIWPIEGSWNDFGLKTQFEYKLVTNGQTVVKSHLHLAFIDVGNGSIEESDPREMVEKAIKRESNHSISAQKLPTFYTIHTSMEGYRKVVQSLDIDAAEDFLLAINDLVAIEQIQKLPPWYQAAIESPQFNLSFKRNSESFFAYCHAGSILNGLQMESLRGMSNRFKLAFRLSAFQNDHVLNFQFEHDSDLPQRVAVVIGKNGVGKSRSLYHFAHSLISGSNLVTDGNGGRPSINRILAVCSPGETRGTFPSARRRSYIDYHRIFLSRTYLGYRQVGLGNVLERLARSNEMIAGKKRWDIFCEAVGSVVPLDQLVVKFRKEANSRSLVGPSRSCSLEELKDGRELERLRKLGSIDPRADVLRSVNGEHFPLSSGQLTFIRFAAQACLLIENGTMVLMDEPETHLHPNYISDFVRLLDKLLEETGSFAILATHSAYFVREVARTQVIVLRQNQSKMIEVLRPRLRTLGADVGEISQFVFEDTGFGFLLEQIQQRIRQDKTQAANLLQAVEGEIAPEAWMELKRESVGQQIQK